MEELAGERECEGEWTGEEEEDEEAVAAASPPRFLSLFNPRRDFLPVPPTPAAAAVTASNRFRLTCNRRRFFSLSGDKLAAGDALLLSGDSDILRFLVLSAAAVSLMATVGFLSLV